MENKELGREYMAIFFTADTHFGRDSFFKQGYTDRHKIWKNAQEMNEALIENWNKTVGRDDTVFILGDFSNIDDPMRNVRLWNRLNGKKKLILGNHDTQQRLDIKNFPLGKVTFPSCTTINTPEWELFLTHYPCLDWTNKYKWDEEGNKIGQHAIQLYGHVHNKELPALEGERAYNVGVDVNNFRPVSLEDILKSLNLTS